MEQTLTCSGCQDDLMQAICVTRKKRCLNPPLLDFLCSYQIFQMSLTHTTFWGEAFDGDLAIGASVVSSACSSACNCSIALITAACRTRSASSSWIACISESCRCCRRQGWRQCVRLILISFGSRSIFIESQRTKHGTVCTKSFKFICIGATCDFVFLFFSLLSAVDEVAGQRLRCFCTIHPFFGKGSNSPMAVQHVLLSPLPVLKYCPTAVAKA
jgi:hypothetical protein